MRKLLVFLAALFVVAFICGPVIAQVATPVDDSYTNVHRAILLNTGDNDLGSGGTPTLYTGPSHGSVSSFQSPTRHFYNPNIGFNGTDSFTYKYCGTFQGVDICSDPATVTIEVYDYGPLAISDFFVLTGTSISMDTFSNDFSLEGDNIELYPESVTRPLDYGQISRITEGWNYVRDQSANGVFGVDYFTYVMRDSGGGPFSNVDYVMILLTPNDDAEDAGRSCPVRLRSNNAPSAPNPNNAVGSPVNTTNGNMWLAQQDYSLPGIGEGISIERFYNSILQNNGIFGLGWSTKYDESLEAYGDNLLVRLNMPDGKAVYFGRTSPSDPFVSVSPDVVGQIVKNEDSTYVVIFKDGRSHKFDSSGVLLWQKDRNGNQTTLGYHSGLLTEVTDSFGRTLSINRGSNDMIESISDSIGTIAAYSYYSGTNRLQAVDYPDGSGFTYLYEEIGGKNYLTTVKDTAGKVLEHHDYDSQGRATTSEVEGGLEAYSFDYTHANDGDSANSGYGSYTTITDSLNHESKYFFKKAHGKNVITKIEGVCSCGGGGSEVTTFNYDAGLNLIKKTDALSHEITFKYDQNRNVTEVEDVLGTQKYTYNSFNDVLTYIDRMNGVYTNTYDAHGNLLTATDPLSHTTTLTYTSVGLPETVTDARSHTTTIDYDIYGRPEKTTDANENKTFFTFDARVRPVSVVNAKNEETLYEFDTRNRVTKVTFPDSNFISYAYDTSGRRTSMTDERGHATTYAYDDAYRLTGITDALNHATTFGYDDMSKLTSVTDALGNVTDYDYDEFNRLEKITYPVSATGVTRLYEEFTYDTAGNLKIKKDTAGRETNYHYDAADRVDYVTDALSQVTHFYYNARSQTTKVKDALDQEYTFTYDALGRKLSQTRAGTTMTYEYDETGNRKKRIDYNGQVTNYTYNALNRLTHIGYTGSTNYADYGYDELSRLTSAENQNGTVAFTYDNRGRTASSTDVYDHTVEYSYDEAGNRKGLKLDGNKHTTYGYDEANRLTEQTDGASDHFMFAYDEANRLITKTLPNGVVSGYTYDGMSRLTRLKHENPSKETVFFDNQYTYNSANQISRIADLNRTRDFSYDPVDRLTEVSVSSSPVESYAYDAVGNRSAYTHAAFNRTTAAGIASLTYDNNGNRYTKAVPQSGSSTITSVYTWDEENRLLDVYSGNGLNDFESAEAVYQYDALGRRIKRSFTLPSGNMFNPPQETYFTYDGNEVVMDADTDLLSSSLTDTYYQNGPGTDNKLKYGASYFLQDHLGSTIGLTDSESYLWDTSEYDSFGSSTNTSLSTRYRFTGRESDSETGLQYSRARWYDPQIGRFISEDPIGFAGGDINLYGYVKNNSLNFIDPMGLDGGPGSRTSDWMDSNIDYAEDYWMSDPDSLDWNTGVIFASNVSHGFSDMFRVGDGTSMAMDCDDDDWYGKAAFILMDVQRASGLFSLMAGPGARFSMSRTGMALNTRLVNLSGREIKFGNNLRIAPLGNRTNNPFGRWPHYHRRGPQNAPGQSAPGQGIGRHRPWETSTHDRTFLDRF